MIIECHSGQARFRLDETRIKGKAARVQCRRCGNAIYVTKPEVPPPAAESTLDLRSLLAGPSGAGPASRPLPDRPSPGATPSY